MRKPSVTHSTVSPEENEREFLKIKQALQQKQGFLEDLVCKRFNSPSPWKLMASDHVLAETGDIIDFVFEHSQENDKRFVLIDFSIPHLQKGQKFSLESKAKQFQKSQGIAMSRIKKGILLIRRDRDTVFKPSSRLHCPIIDLDLPTILSDAPEPQKMTPEQAHRFSQDLVKELIRAIVQECLATMQKRRNKYIRKGLWRWIEREIFDPNVHFFLIILSCIYQGEVSELLSRKFKSIDNYSKTPDEVLENIFSKEACLASEITKNADRHRKALRKFLECFSQTPPFEYLRSIFLKEFRTTRDSVKSRMAVFNTLKELLVRCGFTGEKEINYPLEILDELGIFQGVLLGDYTELRVENATKKLRNLVPDVEWNNEEVYRLRDDLARNMNLSAMEFNLNAFLPQAFVGGSVSERLKKADALSSRGRGKAPEPASHRPPAKPPQKSAEEAAQLTFSHLPATPAENADQVGGSFPAPVPPQTSADAGSAPVEGSVQSLPASPIVATPETVEKPGDMNPRTPSDPKPAFKPEPRREPLHAQEPAQGPSESRPAAPPHRRPPQPSSSHPAPIAPPAPSAPSSPQAAPGNPVRPPVTGEGPRPAVNFLRQALQRDIQKDVDEGKHRFFENFGGHPSWDEDTARFEMELVKFLAEKKIAKEKQDALGVPVEPEETFVQMERGMPSKSQAPKATDQVPVRPMRRDNNPNNRRRKGKSKNRMRNPRPNPNPMNR